MWAPEAAASGGEMGMGINAAQGTDRRIAVVDGRFARWSSAAGARTHRNPDAAQRN